MTTNYENIKNMNIEELAIAQTSVKDGIIFNTVSEIQCSTLKDLIKLDNYSEMSNEDKSFFCQKRNKEKFKKWLKSEVE